MSATSGYIIMTAMPSLGLSSRHYLRIAVCHVADLENPPKMISERAKGMLKIVKTWENLYVGLTAKCAYRRALSEANALANKLNVQAASSA